MGRHASTAGVSDAERLSQRRQRGVRPPGQLCRASEDRLDLGVPARGPAALGRAVDFERQVEVLAEQLEQMESEFKENAREEIRLEEVRLSEEKQAKVDNRKQELEAMLVSMQ